MGFPEITYKDIAETSDVLPDIDAHGYLQGVYRGESKPNGSRLRAAIACLPFERPKLAVLATGRESHLADRMMRAIVATNKVIEGRPVQVIEPPKAVDEVDHSGPFPRLHKF